MIDARNFAAPDNPRTEHRSPSEPSAPATERPSLLHLRSSDRDSVYTRFFTYKKQLTEAELRQLTDVDFEHVVALVVVEIGTDGEELLGGGRYCSEQPLNSARSAELAFVTADAHHGRGVASVILKHLVQHARDRGLTHLDAVVLAHNRAMLAVFQHSGLPMQTTLEAGVLQVRIRHLTNVSAGGAVPTARR